MVTAYDESADQGFAEILETANPTNRRVVDLPSEPFHVLFAQDNQTFHIALANGEIPKISLETAEIVDGGLHAGGTMPEALVRL
ncbi:MAG: hypothetical protein HKN28_05110 [Alphaproteobacteria bacterium]|nr:hypothetical protein [Alphaproteobacteria bacterium]